MNRLTATVLVGLTAVVATSCGKQAAAPGARPTSTATDSTTAGASSTPTDSPSASASPTLRVSPPPSASPSAEPSPPVIATCPARVSNVSGAYSFSCPADWKYVNCEESPFIMPYTWLINPEGCRQQATLARMMVWSRQGEHSAAENTYLGQPQSSKPVVVAGITGTRRTYLVTADNPMPPPQGTVQVVYAFLTGGRSYFAQYDRYPGDADLTVGFDQMVISSLSFSASG